MGSFLSGLAGYRARPTLLEALAYVGYLALAGWLFFGRKGSGAVTVSRFDRSQRSSSQPSVAPR